MEVTEAPGRDATLAAALSLAAGQAGGTLATTHAEDGTPYVTFVLFHLRANGEILFGSGERSQHTRNIRATPEVSFLVDNREVIRGDWPSFVRLVVEGRAEEVPQGGADFAGWLGELEAKNAMAPEFTRNGSLFRVVPRRLILMQGFDSNRQVVEFDGRAQ